MVVIYIEHIFLIDLFRFHTYNVLLFTDIASVVEIHTDDGLIRNHCSNKLENEHFFIFLHSNLSLDCYLSRLNEKKTRNIFNFTVVDVQWMTVKELFVIRYLFQQIKMNNHSSSRYSFSMLLSSINLYVCNTAWRLLKKCLSKCILIAFQKNIEKRFNQSTRNPLKEK